MNIFLRLKHWQLFGLLIGFPFIIQIVSMTTVIVSQDPTKIFTVFPLIMILFMGVFFGWFYALGVNLNKKLPDTVKMSLTKFKWFLVIPTVYIIFFSVFMSKIGSTFESGEIDPVVIFSSFGIIFPIHLFSMFCILYCLYFNAKSLRAVELQRPVTFSDYSGEFFLIWFFPVGIWIIQPRINRIFDGTLQTKE